MDKINEFEFLQQYFKILKLKNSNNIGTRFMNQLIQLEKDKEISIFTFELICSCIKIGESIEDIKEEDLILINELIKIGTEIKEEKDAQKIMKKLANKNSTHKNNSF